MTGRPRAIAIAGAAAVVLLTLAGAMRYRKPTSSVPTATVKRGEFVEYQQIRGEVKAEKSASLSAPFSSGDLQILTLAKNGSTVKRGEVVVEFDPTTLQRTLEQKRTELKSADAEINRSRAQSRLNQEQKTTDALNARYNVERAKLDVSKQEILSEIEAQKAQLALADSQQKSREMEVAVASSDRTGKADMESARQRRGKTQYDVQLAERQIAALILRAPVDGTVTLAPNFRARSYGGGEASPEFKPGDRAWPGAAIAEIPELSSIRMLAHVDEIDRGRLLTGQSALVRVDAIPDKEFTAYLADISAVGKPDFSTWPPPKNFDVILQMQDKDARLRPGMSANARIVVNRTENVITVPAEAVFEKNGRTVVYVQHGSRFEERAVTAGRRSHGEVVLAAGVKEGERVALKDPTVEDKDQ